MHPAFGSLIGAVGGLVFALIGANNLQPAASWGVRAIALIAFALVVWWAVVRQWNQSRQAPPPSLQGIKTYWMALIFQLIAIPAGATALRAIDRAELIIAWVVVVVGAHFLPFARAFRVPPIWRLGIAMIVIGLIGTVGVLVDEAVTPWVGVAAGIAMLGASATPYIDRHL